MITRLVMQGTTASGLSLDQLRKFGRQAVRSLTQTVNTMVAIMARIAGFQ